ncbi:MAG: tRNA 2-thiouridine(34) synthase MnmA [SAR324 cluster bacterium]|nr:tRNA 2-thiouridine(34) synthase MnmA [SAR324 cluster bacterium]MCZ6729489.1 tRNA 2-thiouridine(34) synthase MnmA [SAR324 cluster bacterium]
MTDSSIHGDSRGRPGGRVAIAMSGGVDSSVAAALLVEQGYEVVGVHMKLNDLPDEEKHNKACCSLDDSLDARQVCAKLGIPYYVINFVEPFERQVIDYFVSAYREGKTPNPCVMCNRTIKSTLLLERIREFGCEYLATGHYAKVVRNPDTGGHELHKPKDLRRDQTYFLFGTLREELPYLLFPLADYEKPDARRVAERLQFATWNKPDSQEVCFVPKDYRDFLRARPQAAPPAPGDFVDREGRVLGRHEGLPFYTVGQRRGLGIQGTGPYYVTALDGARNAVVVGKEEDLYASAMEVSGVNWVSCDAPAGPRQVTVKVRYAHAGTRATLEPSGLAAVRVRFHEPVRAITPGQAAAFYDGDVLLGGGWIDSGSAVRDA